ncbi:FAD:protein FMN transferase [Hydrogenivirga sp.]
MLVIALLLSLTSLCLGVEKLFYLMGTYAYMELPTEEEAYRAYRLARSLEKKLSDYIQGSEVSLINENAGLRPVKVSAQTLNVIRLSLAVSRKTYGYFDITVGALTINHRRLGRLSRSEAKELINFRDLEVRGDEVFLRRGGMAIDLGGIGKGYALDVIHRGLDSPWGFIGIAGDMRVWGMKRVIAVKDPLSGGVLLQGVNKRDLCVSTSGNYVKEHIVQRDERLVQVTVVHDVCALADAYATALFSMPRRLRRSFLKENPDVGVLELFSDGSVYMNRAFRGYFRLLLLKSETISQ